MRRGSGVGRAALLSLAAASYLSAQPAPIQTQETNQTGIVADLVECKRSEGVLSIKVRFRNTGDAKVSVPVIKGRNYDDYYVTAGGKKFFVLRDTEKVPLAAPSDGFGNLSANLEKGQGTLWWAKYPAPPAEVRKVSYFTPLGPPFEDVPITDK